jgi:hypothetical protein
MLRKCNILFIINWMICFSLMDFRSVTSLLETWWLTSTDCRASEDTILISDAPNFGVRCGRSTFVVLVFCLYSYEDDVLANRAQKEVILVGTSYSLLATPPRPPTSLITAAPASSKKTGSPIRNEC